MSDTDSIRPPFDVFIVSTAQSVARAEVVFTIIDVQPRPENGRRLTIREGGQSKSYELDQVCAAHLSRLLAGQEAL